MPLKFTFKKEKSSMFGTIRRPLAEVLIWSRKYKSWESVWMLVDTGADYTLLPNYFAEQLGVDLEDLDVLTTYGVGGTERVYLVKKLKVKLGKWNRSIPVGFLERNDIPPLMGRHMFLETFETHFSKKRIVTFED
jgi:predicted aspartyl protease